MSWQTEALGYGAWVLVLVFIGWLIGLAHVAWGDRRRRYEQQKADDAAREAVLAEGRANQQAGFPVHDFDARRETAA